MKIKGLIIDPIWISCFVALLLLLVFQAEFGFLFSAMEGYSLFIWDASIWSDTIFKIGGVSEWLNGFIIQFFHIQILGSFLAAIILSIIFYLCNSICRRISDSQALTPLCLLPIIFLMAQMINSRMFSGVTDFLMSVICVWLYSRSGGNQSRRSVVGMVLGLLLFLSSGSSVTGYLLAIIAFDMLKYKQFIPSIVTAAAIALVCILSVRLCLSADFKTAILPEGKYAYATWMSLLLCFAVFWTTRKLNVQGIILSIILYVLVIATGILVVSKSRNFRQEQLALLSNLAENEDWDGVLSACRHIDMNNYMLLNYANLALSHKGILTEHYSDFRHDSPMVLFIKPDLTAGGMKLCSMIYYQTGNIAAAQEMAFEAEQYGACPFLVKTLVKTNLIYGSYKVAEKYISILEKTLFYHKWASSMRGLLSEDAVNSDKELGAKRTGLPQKDAFTLPDYFPADLMNVLENNYGNIAARDYLVAYLLISRDASALVKFVTKFYGTPALTSLTPDMQYGLLYGTGDVEWCREHGVSDKIIMNYQRQKSSNNKQTNH